MIKKSLNPRKTFGCSRTRFNVRDITHVGNAIIEHSEKNKDMKEIKKAINHAEDKNKKLYKIEPKKYRIIVCDSEKDYLKKTGYKDIGGGACIKWKKIILITPSMQEHFKANGTLYHEINHIFFLEKAKSFRPMWYVEGIAFLNQKYYHPKTTWKKYLKSINNVERYLAVKSNQYKNLEERNKFYILSYFCIKYLEKHYSINKLIDFIDKIPRPYNNSKFWQEFESYFKLSKKDLVEKALK